MSNYALAIKFAAEPLRSLPFGSIPDTTYALIGTYFQHPIRQLFVQNTTNKPLVFSFDGLTDHFYLQETGFLLLDVTANKTQQGGWYIAEGSGIYVLYPADPPTSGAAIVSAFYGSTGYED